jgi:Kdo2-lipid IVA lauroyltransferase/acyltransferase
MNASQSSAAGAEAPFAMADLPWWMRLLSCLPLRFLYALCAVLAWVACRVLRMRLPIVMRNIEGCFPDLPAAAQRDIARAHYRQLGQMIAEVIGSVRMQRDEFLSHVTVTNIELPRAMLAAGRPVLLVAAHQANWEWVLQAMALQLGYPLDVGYKPIKDRGVDRAMNRLRCRFGAHLVPAKDLLPDLLQRRHLVRGIAMLADQEPTTSDHKHWVRFLGRDTAFYMGPEQMARATRYGALFVALRRVRRGSYVVEFVPLAAPGEKFASGEFTARYAALVEKEIRAAPGDWTWGHRRWKLKRGVYAD